WDFCIHHITTPPPNEKNDKKKLDAANAIDSPNTIWMSLRNPPEVSPNASDSPVTMMMMTAMIFATGPSTDCRIWFSGCSHGMFEPAAQAGALARESVANAAIEMKPGAIEARMVMTDLRCSKGCSRLMIQGR